MARAKKPIVNRRFKVTLVQKTTFVMPITAETAEKAQALAEETLMDSEEPWDQYGEAIQADVVEVERVVQDAGAVPNPEEKSEEESEEEEDGES